jgi:hypothetical protein
MPLRRIGVAVEDADDFTLIFGGSERKRESQGTKV